MMSHRYVATYVEVKLRTRLVELSTPVTRENDKRLKDQVAKLIGNGIMVVHLEPVSGDIKKSVLPPAAPGGLKLEPVTK